MTTIKMISQILSEKMYRLITEYLGKNLKTNLPSLDPFLKQTLMHFIQYHQMHFKSIFSLTYTQTQSQK